MKPTNSEQDLRVAQRPGKRIRVALDVSALGPHPSGIGIYADNLARALSRLDDQVECLPLCHRSLEGWPAMAGAARRLGGHFPIRALWMQLILPRLLREIEPDVCHFTNSLAPFWTPYPHVVTIHDMSLSRYPAYHRFPKRYYSRAAIPRVARRADRIVTVSEFSRLDIQRFLGVPKSRIQSIPLAAEPQFRPRDPAESARVQAQYGITGPYWLFVGALEPRKNLCRLVEAIALLAREGRDGGCRLYLAGPRGWGNGLLWRRVRDLGLERRVTWVGYTRREDLPALFSGAVAAVYPSLLEGFGLPVLEALACGAPVVAAAGSSMEEVAGEAAHYVDPFDVASIRDGLARVTRDAELRRELSRRGTARAQQFSWEQTASQTVETYRAILAARQDGERRRGFRLAVETVSPRNPSVVVAGPPVDSAERAILKTVGYAALFDYPLTGPEIAHRLFDSEVDVQDVTRLLDGGPGLKRYLERTGEYYHPAGRSDLVAIRERRERATRDALRREDWVLRTLCRLPWVRMVALSGATAHGNMEPDGDLDLFLVAEEGRAWILFLGIHLLARLAGKRRTLCLNYVVGSRSLRLPHRDFFSAEQLLSLKPLSGDGWNAALLEANPWVFDHFPNRRSQRRRDADAAPPCRSRRRRQGGLDLLDWMILRCYGVYLLRRARGGTADIDLSRRQIKAHLRSHKRDVGIRFQEALRRWLDSDGRRTS